MNKIRDMLAHAWAAIAAFYVRDKKQLAYLLATVSAIVGGAPPVLHKMGFALAPTGGGLAITFQGNTTLGAGPSGPFDVIKEPVVQCQQVNPGCTTIVTESNLAPNEVCDYDGLVDFYGVGASTTANDAKCKTEILGRVLNGQCTTPDGGMNVRTTFFDPGSGVGDAGCTFVTLDAGIMGLQVCTPVAELACASISAVRRLPPWQANDAGTFTDGGICEILQVYPASLGTTIATATQVWIWTDHGCAVGATGATAGTAILTTTSGGGTNGVVPCTTNPVATACVTGWVQPGTYAGGAQTVSLTSSSQTVAPCSSSVPCLSFVSASPPTLTNMDVAVVSATTSGETRTFTGTNLGAGTTLTINGTNCPVVTQSSTSFRCTVPNGLTKSLTAATVTATNAGGSGSLPTSWTSPMPAAGGTALYVAPQYAAWWYGGVGWDSNSAPTVWTDVSSHGYVLAGAGAMTVVSNYNTSGRKAVVVADTGSTVDWFDSTYPDPAAAFTFGWTGQATLPGSGLNYPLVTVNTSGCIIQVKNSSGTMQVTLQCSGGAIAPNTATITSTQNLLVVANTASSQVYLAGAGLGTISTGAPALTGGLYAPFVNISGNTVDVLDEAIFVGALSSGDVAIAYGIMKIIGNAP